MAIGTQDATELVVKGIETPRGQNVVVKSVKVAAKNKELVNHHFK